MFDYTQVTADGIKATLDAALEKADQVVATVVDPATEPTYDNVLGRLDAIEDQLGQVYGKTAFMGYVHPDKEVRDAGNVAEERLQKWGVELIFRSDLYEAIKRFAATAEAQNLAGEKRRFLEFVERDLRRAGHELDSSARDEVKKLTERLVEIGVLFQRNIDEHQDFIIVSSDDLDGLPESYVEGLESGEEEGTHKIGMAYPDVIPFMENSSRRDLRDDLLRRFNSRAVEPNRPLLEEAVNHRRRIAELFGQPSWAHHQLEEKMAKTPEAVLRFYAGLVPGLTELGQTEKGKLAEMLSAEGSRR